MAILNIKPSWSNDDSEASADVNLENRQRSNRLMWTILSTDPGVDTSLSIQQEAAQSYNFKVGMLHPFDNNLYATSVRVSRNVPLMFTLEAQFVAKGSEVGENPLNEPADVEVDFSTQQAEYDQDITGAAIANVNGEGYTVQDEISDMVLVVTRNLPAFDAILAWQYMHRGAVNSDLWYGMPPGTCRVRGLRGRSVNTDNFLYWTVTGTVQVRSAAPGSTAAKAWFARARHEGFQIRPAAGADPKPAREIENGPGDVSNPVLLKADGTWENNPANAVWQEWQMAPSLPFASLQFF